MVQMHFKIIWALVLITVVFSQSMDGYFTYDEFREKIKDYDYAFFEEFSYQRREIPYIKLSNPDGMETRKSILLVGGLNASPIALRQLFWNIDNLIKEATPDNREIDSLLRTTHIYIVPMLNVDAYHYISENWDDIKADPTASTRQKNMNNLDCIDGSYGVDLSRNFGYEWSHDEIGSSVYPCNADYRGIEPFSEPETRGVRDLANSLDVSLYMSYETGLSQYLHPYSYWSNRDYDGPYSWFYSKIKSQMRPEIQMGTIHELSGVTQNGADIDYFEHTVKCPAIQVLLNEADFSAEDFEHSSPPILSENYYLFERIVLRSGNTFTTTSTMEEMSECTEDCAINSVGIMKFAVDLVYEDYIDSDPVYLRFWIENPTKHYQLYYRDLTYSKISHHLTPFHLPTSHPMDVDNSNIEFEVDLGTIDAESNLHIELLIEYSKDSETPNGMFIDYEFYVGFAEDKTAPGLFEMIYKRFDKVPLKHSIYAKDPIDPD